jgi:hypothetical protein
MPVTPGAAGGPVVSTQHSQLATVEGSIALREHKHPNVLIRSPSVLGICEVRDNTIFVREGRCFKRSSFTPVLLFKGDAIVRAKLASPLRYAKPVSLALPRSPAIQDLRLPELPDKEGASQCSASRNARYPSQSGSASAQRTGPDTHAIAAGRCGRLVGPVPRDASAEVAPCPLFSH